MPIEVGTRGLNWKAVMRQQNCFCAIVTSGWHEDRRAQRQYAYAQELALPIFLCIQEGTQLPPNAGAYHWRTWRTSGELMMLIAAVENGTWGD